MPVGKGTYNVISVYGNNQTYLVGDLPFDFGKGFVGDPDFAEETVGRANDADPDLVPFLNNSDAEVLLAGQACGNYLRPPLV
jgi:hypothetical protein